MRIRTTVLTITLVLATLVVGSTSTLSASAALPKCGTGALSMTIGQANGTAGTVYFPLVFTNDTTHACTLVGTPTVHADTAINSMGGPLLGPAAREVNAKVKGYGGPVTIPPRGHASAAFGVVDTGAFSPAQCIAKQAQSISVSLQGRMYWAALKFKVCTKITSLTISGVVRGTTGIA